MLYSFAELHEQFGRLWRDRWWDSGQFWAQLSGMAGKIFFLLKYGVQNQILASRQPLWCRFGRMRAGDHGPGAVWRCYKLLWDLNILIFSLGEHYLHEFLIYICLPRSTCARTPLGDWTRIMIKRKSRPRPSYTCRAVWQQKTNQFRTGRKSMLLIHCSLLLPWGKTFLVLF